MNAIQNNLNEEPGSPMLVQSFQVIRFHFPEKYFGARFQALGRSVWATIIVGTLFFISLFSPNAKAQGQAFALEEYLELVRMNHPMSRQALLLSEQANAYMLKAKGGFDPKLYGDWERKSFDGKNYFNIGEGGMKLPTWYGIEGKLAYNWTSGIFLNPENNLPANGQAIVGLKVPLLQGLVIDQRRADLFQGRFLRKANANEQRLVMNNLLFNAAKIYWEWALANAYFRVYERAVEVATIRYEAVKLSYIQGDEPAIDTLEAYIQVQDRTLQRNDARVLMRNATLELRNFLWGNENPMPVDTTQQPVGLEAAVQEVNLLGAPPDELAANHPELVEYDFKIKGLEVERRLKAEMLKPRVDVEYNLLGDGLDLRPNEDNGAVTDLLRENYKLGASVSFPLFFRKERGDLRLTDLKLTEAGLGMTQKRQELRNKISAYQNNLKNLQQQIGLATQMRDNYERLLRAENIKFQIGESSLFLINSRENKLIEAELKLAKLQSELRKAEIGVQWAAGRLE
ncbi:MAG: TolC family protein [Bacteroidota bacterium]